jgi:C-terminal processing protease CtpA/Prc
MSDPSQISLKSPSIFSKSPLGRVCVDSSRSVQRSVMAVQQNFIGESMRSLHQRRSSSDVSDDLRITGSTLSGHSDTSTNVTTPITESRLEFEAPRMGQLGLVIESNSRTGPLVHSVKDYSPLFGMVRKGDRLVEIDGRDTSQCRLLDVTRLLKVKPAAYRAGSSNIRIVVARPSRQDKPNSQHHHKDGNPSGNYSHRRRHNHQRNTSHGGSSCSSGASSRIGEDVNDEGPTTGNDE